MASETTSQAFNGTGLRDEVDATGSPAGLDLSRQLCQPLGTLVLKSRSALAQSRACSLAVTVQVRRYTRT